MRASRLETHTMTLKGAKLPVELKFALDIRYVIPYERARNGRNVRRDPDALTANLVLSAIFPNGVEKKLIGSFNTHHNYDPIILNARENTYEENKHALIDFVETCRGYGSIITVPVLIEALKKFSMVWMDYFDEIKDE